ncbi:MAG: glycosyltransferase, partial [Bdellovibrionota bacterium]
TERREESAFKKASAWFFYRLLDRLSGIAIPKDTGDFRVMTREVTNALLTCREADPFLRGLVTWVGFIQKPFPYKRDGRKFGTTKYPLSKMLRFAVTAIVSFSDLPLRIALWVGVLGLAFFAIIGTWALFNFLDGHTVPGWTSLLIGFAFGQSITLIVVGVLGYYVGHTFKHVQKRPRYILRESAPRSVTK